jgi:hypothetical protein
MASEDGWFLSDYLKAEESGYRLYDLFSVEILEVNFRRLAKVPISATLYSRLDDIGFWGALDAQAGVSVEWDENGTFDPDDLEAVLACIDGFAIVAQDAKAFLERLSEMVEAARSARCAVFYWLRDIGAPRTAAQSQGPLDCAS